MKLPFEYTYTVEKIDANKYPNIRDKKDLPVLVSAITEDVDILITGDKDFFDVEIESRKYLRPHNFWKNIVGAIISIIDRRTGDFSFLELH